MEEIAQFDVLVVYSAKIATSAASANGFKAPFSPQSKNEAYNYPYAYFLETCAQNKLTAAFTTSADITGPGQCSSYWLYDAKTWTKKAGPCFSTLIFDKFSPSNQEQRLKRQMFFSSPQVRPFNNESLFALLFDKHKTYKKLTGFALPTVAIKDGSTSSIDLALKRLKAIVAAHPGSNDFSDAVVIKDRFGAGGLHVYKLDRHIAARISSIMERHPRTSFVIQPFAKFDQGYSHEHVLGSTDIRLIYQGRKIVQTYIRTAKPGDFRCNEHQGGVLTYVPLRHIPFKVIRLANRIADLVTQDHSLFALDFIITNNGNVYLLEGNTGPGLDWNLSSKKNELMAKKLIRIIVKNLARRVGILPAYL